MKLANIFSRLSTTPPPRAVYSQIVAKARQPWLYLKAGVPDTVTGRFDMITLHSFFVLEHLGGNGDKAAQFAQELFDELFMDMDHSLREMGVGDLSVGKKVRKMSESYYGACNAYRSAFQADGQHLKSDLGKAFQRNIIGNEAMPEKLENLVDYAVAANAQVCDQKVEKILSGKLVLPDLAIVSKIQAGSEKK